MFDPLQENFSGIDFFNKLTINDSINILKYEYLYNGGGVAVGNLNGDDLPDIVFSGNQVPSKIYLNQGQLQFKDITASSGINTQNTWCTGVNLIDINQDGLDDIYFCVGGIGNKSQFPNKLYINQGNATFKESAQEYGLNDPNESIQSLFFDFDLDGDLDMYLLTGGGFERSPLSINRPVSNGYSRNTDHLYRNDFDEKLGHPVFTDISKEAGILWEGFGLGVSIFDANSDSWPDIYVSNDYTTRDLLYINQKNGTFIEQALDYFSHMSFFSMGNDVADINNDGLLDLFTTDMLPEDLKRRKLMSGSFSYDVFHYAKNNGYGEQYMRNMLQLNNGNGSFSEIGQFAGIEKTDWSWSPLFADFDNDGFVDLFITNGFGKDITDMDFVKFREEESNKHNYLNSVLTYLTNLPEINSPNYLYKNNGNNTFSHSNKIWGMNQPMKSNGSAFADLDQDGDLDLILNNLNEKSIIFKNNTNKPDSIKTNFIQLNLRGPDNNLTGIGTKIQVFTNGQIQTRYQQATKGFQSKSFDILHFGLSKITKIDSIYITWPDLKMEILYGVPSNQNLTISYKNAKEFPLKNPQETIFKEEKTIDYLSKEFDFNDFSVQALLQHGFSRNGPIIQTKDINQDGMDDLFVGGSYGSSSMIYYQKKNGSFQTYILPDTEKYEDTDALIFDANGDNNLDILITSGGSERYQNHPAYQDRLYINQGSEFILGEFPTLRTSSSCVSGGDFDQDGDIDLFIGGQSIPGKFPESPNSYILENQKGKFINITHKIDSGLTTIGMVREAVWIDFNKDEILDLALVGEWMNIHLYQGNKTGFTKINLDFPNSGLWNSLKAQDLDLDGDIDFIIGNIGLNSHFITSPDHPFKLEYADFDENGTIDPFYSQYEEGDYYPIANLDEIGLQLPSLKKNYLKYADFAKSNTKKLLEQYKNIPFKTLKAEEFQSIILENRGNNQFRKIPLPKEAQYSIVNDILIEDINHDLLPDLVLIGNNLNTEVKYGSLDANKGQVFINKGKLTFDFLSNEQSGLNIQGKATRIQTIKIKNENYILVAINNEKLKTYKLK